MGNGIARTPTARGATTDPSAHAQGFPATEPFPCTIPLPHTTDPPPQVGIGPDATPKRKKPSLVG